MSKNEGDGFLPPWFKRYECPNCKKKGVYYAGSPDPHGLIGDYKCMYCKGRFQKKEIKTEEKQ